VLAQKVLKEGGAKDEEKIDFLAKRLLSRSFSEPEMKIVLASLKDLSAAFAAKPDEAKKLLTYGEAKADATMNPAQLAAWTMLTNQLMNLDEVLNK
jgi:cytochrome c551/c552